MGYVLDTSVLLAYLKQEVGGDVLQHYLEGDCYLSVVNQIEFYSYFVRVGLQVDEAEWFIDQMGISIKPLDEMQVALAARMLDTTKSHGLSLGDRVCLALAISLATPVITADRLWSNVKTDAEIVQIRS